MSSYVIVDFIHGDMFYVKTEKKIIFVKLCICIFTCIFQSVDYKGFV